MSEPTAPPRSLLILLSASIGLAVFLTNDALTPIWFFPNSRSEIPGIKWLVMFAESATLAAILWRQRGFGLSLALCSGIAHVAALALNFLASMALGEVSFFYFYLLQLGIVVMAWLALRKEPAADRQTGRAVTAVAIWGALILVVGLLGR